MNRRTNTPRDRLRTIIAAETSRSVPETVVASAAELRRRFGASTVAIVFYGSALRDGLAPDSLLDF